MFRDSITNYYILLRLKSGSATNIISLNTLSCLHVFCLDIDTKYFHTYGHISKHRKNMWWNIKLKWNLNKPHFDIWIEFKFNCDLSTMLKTGHKALKMAWKMNVTGKCMKKATSVSNLIMLLFLRGKDSPSVNAVAFVFLKTTHSWHALAFSNLHRFALGERTGENFHFEFHSVSK